MLVTKIQKLAALVLVLALTAGGTGAFAYRFLAEDAKKTDKENILGEWKVATLKMNGQDAPGEEGEALKNSIVEFKPDKILIKRKDGDRESTYKLDPTAKPKTIEIVHMIPGGGEEKMRCIYKLEGDTLTICGKHAGGGDDLPTEFESKEGSGTILMVLKREKK